MVLAGLFMTGGWRVLVMLAIYCCNRVGKNNPVIGAGADFRRSNSKSLLYWRYDFSGILIKTTLSCLHIYVANREHSSPQPTSRSLVTGQVDYRRADVSAKLK